MYVANYLQTNVKISAGEEVHLVRGQMTALPRMGMNGWEGRKDEGDVGKKKFGRCEAK